jgi:hypothetical protein
MPHFKLGWCILTPFISNQNCAGAPRCKEAVQQLLSLINGFLIFRFKGLKCLIFVVFLLLSVIVGRLQAMGYVRASAVVYCIFN